KVRWIIIEIQGPMARNKQALNKDSVAGAAPSYAAKPAAKPTTTRVRSSKHSKAVSTAEPEIETPTAELEFEQPVPAALETLSAVMAPAEDAQQEISAIAYGYWAARGYQGGSPVEDWTRAEE